MIKFDEPSVICQGFPPPKNLRYTVSQKWICSHKYYNVDIYTYRSHTHAHTHAHIHTHTYTHSYTHAHRHEHMHIHYTYTYTCMQLAVCTAVLIHVTLVDQLTAAYSFMEISW